MNLSTSRLLMEYVLHEDGRDPSTNSHPHELRWTRTPAAYGASNSSPFRSSGMRMSFTRLHGLPGMLQFGSAFCCESRKKSFAPGATPLNLPAASCSAARARGVSAEPSMAPATCVPCPCLSSPRSPHGLRAVMNWISPLIQMCGLTSPIVSPAPRFAIITPKPSTAEASASRVASSVVASSAQSGLRHLAHDALSSTSKVRRSAAGTMNSWMLVGKSKAPAPWAKYCDCVSAVFAVSVYRTEAPAES
mmetsp:Transcript_11603/g.28147  ORF Transcript_11603/g.28147 Transcript_11603/m.28147 type:complete len:248 (+) Transcript_11603:1184-1927(+)